MVASPLLKPFFAEAQMVRPMLRMRTVAAVEAQIVTPPRQPSKPSRLGFFRSRLHFVVLMLGVSQGPGDPSSGAVPDLIYAVSDCTRDVLGLVAH